MSYLEPSPTNFFRRSYVRDYDPNTYIPDDLPSMWLNTRTMQVFLFVGQQNGVGRWSNITTIAAGDVSSVSITDGTDTALAASGVFRINNVANSGIMILLGGNVISIMIEDGGVISQKIATGAVTRDKLSQDIINDINNAQQSGQIRVNTSNISDLVDTSEIQWLVSGTTASASLVDLSVEEAKLSLSVQTKLNATGDRINVNGSPAENINNSPEIQWTQTGNDVSASIAVQSIAQDKLTIAAQTLLNRQLQFNNQDVTSISTGNHILTNYNGVTKNLDITVQLPAFPQPLQFQNQNVSVVEQGENITMSRSNAGELSIAGEPPVRHDEKIVKNLIAGANVEINTTEDGDSTITSLSGGDAVVKDFSESEFTRYDAPSDYTSNIEFLDSTISNAAPYTSIFEYNGDMYEGQLVTLSATLMNCQQDFLFDVVTLTVAEMAMIGYTTLSDANFYSFTRNATNVIVAVRNEDGSPAIRALVDIRRPVRDANNVITGFTDVMTVNPDAQGEAILGDVQAHDVIFISAVWEYADAINYFSVKQDVALRDGDASRFERTELHTRQGIEDITFDFEQTRDDVVKKSELLEIVREDIAVGSEEVVDAFYNEKTQQESFLHVITPTQNYVECLVIAIKTSSYKRFLKEDGSVNIRLMRNVGGTITSGAVTGGTTTVLEENLDWQVVGERENHTNTSGKTVIETLYQAEYNVTTETGFYWLQGHTAHNLILAISSAPSTPVTPPTVMAGSKDVVSSSFTVTAGTGSTSTSTTSSAELTLVPPFPAPTVGTKTFNGNDYTLFGELTDRTGNYTDVFDSRELTGEELANLGWTNALSSATYAIFKGSTTTLTLGDTTADSDPAMLWEIWRPTYNEADVLVAGMNVFQMRREDAQEFTNISVQQGDIFLYARDNTETTVPDNIRISAPDGFTVTVTGITPMLGSTAKMTSTETQLFNDLTFDSRQERDDIVASGLLFDRRTTTLTDPEAIPFLFLEDTRETVTAMVDSENTAGFVENPIFSIRSSYVESFKVSEDSGNITSNIRVVRVRGETATTLSATTVWSLRGKVASATDANAVDISSNVYYCFRLIDAPQSGDIYRLAGHTSRHEIAMATPEGMMSGIVDQSRLFTTAHQKTQSNAKTYLLSITQSNIDAPLRTNAIYGSGVQESSTYTLLTDDLSEENFRVRIRSSVLLKANFGVNLRLVILRGGTEINYNVDSTYIGAGSAIMGAVDSEGNDISNLAFIAINFPVMGNLEENDIIRLETHTSVNILQEQQDIINNTNMISVLRTAIMNLPTPTTATLPKVLQDLANNLTETNVAEGTGTWRRVSPDPYIDRINVSREFALFEDGENRTTTGDNQTIGNTFTDVMPDISIFTTTPRYYESTTLTHPWPARTTFDEQKVTVENMPSETTPIQNIWGKILVFDIYIYDVNNFPTTSVDLLRCGADDAHPVISMRRVGNEVRIYAETITSRSAGSSTYTYRIQLNANPVIIDGMIGQENNHFIVIPDDWGVNDDIRMRFFLFRKSDHTLFTNVQTVPSSTFNIADLAVPVPEVEFTVSWTLPDGTVISSPYHAEYRAVRNGNGDYTMELSNASLSNNLGSDYQAEVYVDRGTLTSHGSVNNYTQEQMGSGMTTGESRTFVVTFYPNDDELTNADARLYMVYADSTAFNNNINLDRAIGDNGLAFNRITYNDNPNVHASAISRMESYSYTTNPLVPSHSELITMWQNAGNYIGLFVHPTRNVMAFRVTSPIEWLADNIGSGGGGSKDVTTSTFTSMDGTAGVAGTPAITEEVVPAGTVATHYSVGSSTGSKKFDGNNYELWSDTGSADTNLALITTTRAFTSSEIAVLGWVGANARSFNVFEINGTIDVANNTRSGDQPIFVEIWRPTYVNGVLTSATVVFQMRLIDNVYQTGIMVESGDIFLTALWPPDYPSYATALIRVPNAITNILTPAVPAVDPIAGSVTKTSTANAQTFNDLTFDSRQQREDVTEKGSLLERIVTTLTTAESIPFLYLNNTRESLTFGISGQDATNFVANPVFSIRNSYIESFKTSEDATSVTTNIRIVRTRSGTDTTINETTTWTLRGMVTDAQSFHLLDVSENLYWCTSITDTPENGDLYRVDGHTEKIELDAGLRYLGRIVDNVAEGDGVDLSYNALTRTLAISGEPGFASGRINFSSTVATTNALLNVDLSRLQARASDSSAGARSLLSSAVAFYTKDRYVFSRSTVDLYPEIGEFVEEPQGYLIRFSVGQAFSVYTNTLRLATPSSTTSGDLVVVSSNGSTTPRNGVIPVYGVSYSSPTTLPLINQAGRTGFGDAPFVTRTFNGFNFGEISSSISFFIQGDPLDEEGSVFTNYTINSVAEGTLLSVPLQHVPYNVTMVTSSQTLVFIGEFTADSTNIDNVGGRYGVCVYRPVIENNVITSATLVNIVPSFISNDDDKISGLVEFDVEAGDILIPYGVFSSPSVSSPGGHAFAVITGITSGLSFTWASLVKKSTTVIWGSAGSTSYYMASGTQTDDTWPDNFFVEGTIALPTVGGGIVEISVTVIQKDVTILPFFNSAVESVIQGGAGNMILRTNFARFDQETVNRSFSQQKVVKSGTILRYLSTDAQDDTVAIINDPRYSLGGDRTSFSYNFFVEASTSGNTLNGNNLIFASPQIDLTTANTSADISNILEQVTHTTFPTTRTNGHNPADGNDDDLEDGIYTNEVLSDSVTLSSTSQPTSFVRFKKSGAFFISTDVSGGTFTLAIFRPTFAADGSTVSSYRQADVQLFRSTTSSLLFRVEKNDLLVVLFRITSRAELTISGSFDPME